MGVLGFRFVRFFKEDIWIISDLRKKVGLFGRLEWGCMRLCSFV